MLPASTGPTRTSPYPRSAVLGAILLTAYMGGTVATHFRAGSPVFSTMLFGVYLAIMAWADYTSAAHVSAGSAQCRLRPPMKCGAPTKLARRLPNGDRAGS